MPEYYFICPANQRRPGCVEALYCATPFLGQQRAPNGQVYNVPNAQQTWAWLAQQGLPFPPGVSFACRNITPYPNQEQNRSPMLIAVHYTPAPVQATQVQINAPYNTPVGNRGQNNVELPVVGAPRVGQQGAFEVLPDAALPGNADPMLGEHDGQGGTYSDIQSDGTEYTRPDGVLKPFDPQQQQMPSMPGR
jgi:hypothetical protein